MTFMPVSFESTTHISYLLNVAVHLVSWISLYAYVSVCAHAYLGEPHVQTSPNFICMLPVTITQSSFHWRRCDTLCYGMDDSCRVCTGPGIG